MRKRKPKRLRKRRDREREREGEREKGRERQRSAAQTQHPALSPEVTVLELGSKSLLHCAMPYSTNRSSHYLAATNTEALTCEVLTSHHDCRFLLPPPAACTCPACLPGPLLRVSLESATKHQQNCNLQEHTIIIIPSKRSPMRPKCTVLASQPCDPPSPHLVQTPWTAS